MYERNKPVASGKWHYTNRQLTLCTNKCNDAAPLASIATPSTVIISQQHLVGGGIINWWTSHTTQTLNTASQSQPLQAMYRTSKLGLLIMALLRNTEQTTFYSGAGPRFWRWGKHFRTPHLWWGTWNSFHYCNYDVWTHLPMWLGGLVASALGMRTRRPRFESRVAALGSYRGQVVYTHCLLSFSAPINWGTKGSFQHLSGYGD